jgi:nitrogen fixation protein
MKHKHLPSQNRFSHKFIFEKLRTEFGDNPAKLMSEILLQLFQRQDDRLHKSIDKFSKRIDRFTQSVNGTIKHMEASLATMASKKDLEAALATMASKKDLEVALATMASKKDLEAGLATMASKKDLEEGLSKMISKDFFHKEMTAQTRFISALLMSWSALILGGVYFMIQQHTK